MVFRPGRPPLGRSRQTMQIKDMTHDVSFPLKKLTPSTQTLHESSLMLYNCNRANSTGEVQESFYPEVFQFPSQMCRGRIRRWRLRPGLDLMIHNLECLEKTIIKRDSVNSPLRLGMSFCLTGHIQGTSPNGGQETRLQAGRVGLGVMNGASRTIEYTPGQRIVLVHLHIQPDAIPLSAQETTEQLPLSLKKAIAEQKPASYFHASPMTTVMQATVRQLLNCPYHGLSQRLYLESKTIELMSLYFDQLCSSHRLRHRASSLKADEIDRIVHAKDILLSQIANPPTLMELAHQSGLNDRKLKQGFRQVFGTTVFGYLHNYRMQQAQQLLLMPKATISGVAQIVGYRNPEAFSVAFRRTFDISPKAYQMKQR